MIPVRAEHPQMPGELLAVPDERKWRFIGLLLEARQGIKGHMDMDSNRSREAGQTLYLAGKSLVRITIALDDVAKLYDVPEIELAQSESLPPASSESDDPPGIETVVSNLHAVCCGVGSDLVAGYARGDVTQNPERHPAYASLQNAWSFTAQGFGVESRFY